MPVANQAYQNGSGGGMQINDGAISRTSGWSSEQIVKNLAETLVMPYSGYAGYTDFDFFVKAGAYTIRAPDNMANRPQYAGSSLLWGVLLVFDAFDYRLQLYFPGAHAEAAKVIAYRAYDGSGWGGWTYITVGYGVAAPEETREQVNDVFGAQAVNNTLHFQEE